ncbi:MAG: hypothetical protein GEV10_09760 [Streptosporangiales bacterium]|nr:hypothetical protein [Streptosporangiales bacterium]
MIFATVIVTGAFLVPVALMIADRLIPDDTVTVAHWWHARAIDRCLFGHPDLVQLDADLEFWYGDPTTEPLPPSTAR